jgi:hypothetical protein
MILFRHMLPMKLEFNGKIWFWRGPAPWHFVTVPAEQSRNLQAISGLLTYGWGVIPVTVRIGKTEWTTSLFPKEGRYIVPIKASVRKTEKLEEGDEVAIRLEAGRKMNMHHSLHTSEELNDEEV